MWGVRLGCAPAPETRNASECHQRTNERTNERTNLAVEGITLVEETLFEQGLALHAHETPRVPAFVLF